MASVNEIRQRAREMGVTSILTDDYEDPHAFVVWDEKNPKSGLVPQRFTVEQRVVDHTEVRPNTGFSPSALLAGSVVDFKLDSNDVSVIAHAALAFNITNSTGAAVVLPPTSFWFDKIEVLAPNGNQLLTIQDIDNWLALCMLPRNDFEQIAALTGTTTAYSTAGVSIANGASTELYLPLFTMFMACRLNLAGIKGDLTFRFRLKAAALNLISGTHPTFTNCCMLLSGFDEPQSSRNARTAAYMGRLARLAGVPLHLPFYGWDHFTTSQALAPSTRVELKMNGFSGMFSAVFLLIRALPLTAANQGTFIQLESTVLQDESQNIFCGNHNKSHARSRWIAAAQMPSLSAQSVNYYMTPFSVAVPTDFAVGQVHGYQVFRGNESVVFTPTAGLSAGNYQIDVVGLRAQTLRIQNGDIEIRK